MTHTFESLFWLGVFWLAYVYAGYPALLWALGFFRSFRPTPAHVDLPTVSVLLSARNEEKDIGWKIEETLAWDYPKEKLELLVASDASEDCTEEILKKVTDPRFRYLRLDQRRGKSEALNRLSELAHGDLLVFSDANSHMDPGMLRKLVRHFADSRVGCVTGIERTICEKEESAVARAARASLGYEAFVNALESRLGSVLVCDGSVFCIRRSLFGSLASDVANDFELPVRIGADGHAILFDPFVTSLERSTSSPREEFLRKRRICGQGILGFWRFRRYLTGLRAWQMISRKFLRWFGTVPLALVLLSSSRLASRPLYSLALDLQIIFYGLALVGWCLAARGQRGSRATRLPFYFVMVNIAALVGAIEGMLGKRFTLWESPALSRGRREEAPLESRWTTISG